MPRYPQPLRPASDFPQAASRPGNGVLVVDKSPTRSGAVVGGHLETNWSVHAPGLLIAQRRALGFQEQDSLPKVHQAGEVGEVDAPGVQPDRRSYLRVRPTNPPRRDRLRSDQRTLTPSVSATVTNAPEALPSHPMSTTPPDTVGKKTFLLQGTTWCSDRRRPSAPAAGAEEVMTAPARRWRRRGLPQVVIWSPVRGKNGGRHTLQFVFVQLEGA